MANPYMDMCMEHPPPPPLPPQKSLFYHYHSKLTDAAHCSLITLGLIPMMPGTWTTPKWLKLRWVPSWRCIGVWTRVPYTSRHIAQTRLWSELIPILGWAVIMTHFPSGLSNTLGDSVHSWHLKWRHPCTTYAQLDTDRKHTEDSSYIQQCLDDNWLQVPFKFKKNPLGSNVWNSNMQAIQVWPLVPPPPPIFLW